MLLNRGVGIDTWESIWLQGDQPVTLKGNQHQILIGMTEVEVPIFYPPVLKIRLIGKVPDAGKDWRQKEKRAAKDEVVRGS